VFFTDLRKPVLIFKTTFLYVFPLPHGQGEKIAIRRLVVPGLSWDDFKEKILTATAVRVFLLSG